MGPGVTVNVSARHIAAAGFPQLARGVQAGTGLAPQRLCLEITETLVLDDFETGASSVTALHRLPVRAFTIIAEGTHAQGFVSGRGAGTQAPRAGSAPGCHDGSMCCERR